MNENEKSIPQSILHNGEIEAELLGSLLLKEGKVISDVAAILNPDDFYFDAHKIIYQIILEIHSRGAIPNVLNIWEELQKRRDFDAGNNASVFTEVLTTIDGAAFTTAYAVDHAQIVKGKSIRRQAIALINQLKRDLDNPTIDTDKILNSAESAFKSFTDATKPPTLITPNTYFTQLLDADIAKNKIYAERRTGFSNIDEHQIFSSGLYLLGATPAAGKTTFAWQFLDQLAQNGETCIFCSYEMSALELYSKTLARELFLRDTNTTLTAADIRKGATSNTLESIKQEIKADKDFKGVNLFELRDESVDDMLRLIRPFCSKDKSPIICIDYLQIIPPPSEKSFTDKTKIDDIVHKLKIFQRETNTTVIVVSSFNRVNYYAQVTFESFKESGNIEYTADVVWALQLNIANQIKNGAGISDIRKKFEDAKKQKPREIQLKCLKNRQGNNYDCFFNYYSAHDYFQPCAEFDSLDDSPKNDPQENEKTWCGFKESEFTPISKAEQKKLDNLFND